MQGAPPSTFPGLVQVMHPLVRDKISRLRDHGVDSGNFRRIIYEISLLLAYEATLDLPLEEKEIMTPLEKAVVPVIRGPAPILFPILRAGLGMVDAFLAVLPEAAVGHVGIGRDEQTLEPRQYFLRMPPSGLENGALILDPMLATGGSASHAMAILKDKRVRTIRLVSIIAAPEGVERIRREHPDVRIIVGSLDRELNHQGYILPGLGDAGDRMYGTPDP